MHLKNKEHLHQVGKRTIIVTESKQMCGAHIYCNTHTCSVLFQSHSITHIYSILIFQITRTAKTELHSFQHLDLSSWNNCN